MNLRFWCALFGGVFFLCGTGAAMAQDAPAPFGCVVQPDGKSVKLSVSNPHAHEAYCRTYCEFSTTRPGTVFTAACGKSVAAGTKDFDLCTKTYESGTLSRFASGKAECLNSEVKKEQTDDEEDEDSDALIQRLQKQSRDMLDTLKK